MLADHCLSLSVQQADVGTCRPPSTQKELPLRSFSKPVLFPNLCLGAASTSRSGQTRRMSALCGEVCWFAPKCTHGMGDGNEAQHCQITCQWSYGREIHVDMSPYSDMMFSEYLLSKPAVARSSRRRLYDRTARDEATPVEHTRRGTRRDSLALYVQTVLSRRIVYRVAFSWPNEVGHADCLGSRLQGVHAEAPRWSLPLSSALCSGEFRVFFRNMRHFLLWSGPEKRLEARVATDTLASSPAPHF